VFRETSALNWRPRQVPDAVWSRAFYRYDYHLRARLCAHAEASAKYKYNLILNCRADWAWWLHHSSRVTGRHLRGFSRQAPDLPNLLLDPNLSRKVMEQQEDLRQIVCQQQSQGCRSRRSWFLWVIWTLIAASAAANLIQAQRDYSAPTLTSGLTPKARFTPEWEKA